MDHLDRLRLFVRLVECCSFTTAAADRGMPRSSATDAIKRLEADLGARLLDRTTRHVTPTLDGQDYYRRCLAILADLDEAEGALRGTTPRGHLRIDAHPLLTRTFLLPHLDAFFARYPDITLHLGQGDRFVDLVREGVDCVIRSGPPKDSQMIMRPLGVLHEITVASPGYLARHGTPRTPDDFVGHLIVGFLSSRTGDILPLELAQGRDVRELRLPCRVSANDSDTMADLARRGYGLAQAPRYRFAEDLASGALVEVLPDWPPLPSPLNALYPQNRQLAPRLRAFLDWATGIFPKDL